MDSKTQDFLQRLKDSGHWNDDYDYSGVVFSKKGNKVIVEDKLMNTKHSILPGYLLNGKLLKRNNAINKTDYVIKEFRKVHGQKYDYSEFLNYEKFSTPIKIKCKTHGIFYMTSNSHLFF